jgi:hypothetical protein
MRRYLSQLRNEEQVAKQKKAEEQKLQKEEEESKEKSLDEQKKLSVSAMAKNQTKRKPIRDDQAIGSYFDSPMQYRH